MKTIPVLSTNNNYTPIFNGKVVARGNNWPVRLKTAFEESPVLNNIAKDLDKNICGRISRKVQRQTTLFRNKGDNIYRINLFLEQENPSALMKFVSFILRPFHKKLTNHYHSEFSTMDIIQHTMSEYFVKLKLGIK